MRTIDETNHLYGLTPTTDRIAKMLRDGPPRGYYCQVQQHIERKKRQLRQRRHELGLEGQNPVEFVKQTVAVRDIAAAMKHMD